MSVGASSLAVLTGMANSEPERPVAHVCMHVLNIGRRDARVLRAAAALVRANVAVTIVDLEDDYTRPLRETIDGIRFKHVRPPLWLTRTHFKPFVLLHILWMFWLRLRTVVGTPADLYHAHDANALRACSLAARRWRKPVLLDSHELPLVERYYQTRWYRRLMRALYVRQLKRLLPGCVAAITVSPPIVDELQRRYGGPRAEVVRNLPPYWPPRASDRLRERLELGPDVRLALYQGALRENRALDRLVSAALYLDPGIVVVIMGDGPCQGAIAAQIARDGLGDRVKLLPAVPYAELLEWTASADLGLNVLPPDYSPSIRYCLPNKLFEYLMAGVPVLTSPLEAVVEVLRTYGAGSVVGSLEPEVVAGAINGMLGDPEALARMRQNALAACARDLRWDVEQKHLLDLYQRLLLVPLGVGVSPRAVADQTMAGQAAAMRQPG